MGLFKRKKKVGSRDTYQVIHDIKVPFTPFGNSITNSDVVKICIDRIASQCAKLKGRYIKIDEEGVQTEKREIFHLS